MKFRIAAAAALAMLAALAAGRSADARLETVGPSLDLEPVYTFLSAPDYMNGDVADVTTAPGWEPGDPNSWNDSYAVAVDVTMVAFAAEQPDDMFVAGDLVRGHWGRDDENTGIFGPVGTVRQRVKAVRVAGNHYYTAWRALFADRGLNVYTAIGDHEYGDNPWSGNWYNNFKRNHMDVFQQTYAEAFPYPRANHPASGRAAPTAYAVRPHPEVQLVTLDVFWRTDTGVIPKVAGEQLRWLHRVLNRANADGLDWIIVQAHTPVLGPVRHQASSQLMLQGGAKSPLWRELVAQDVDLYLCGEVHAVTARRAGGVTQISHGGILANGLVNYLTGDVIGDRLVLRSLDFNATPDNSAELWQTSMKRPAIGVSYEPIPIEIGRMRLHKDGDVLGRSGILAPYRG